MSINFNTSYYKNVIFTIWSWNQKAVPRDDTIKVILTKRSKTFSLFCNRNYVITHSANIRHSVAMCDATLQWRLNVALRPPTSHVLLVDGDASRTGISKTRGLLTPC